MDAGVQMVEMDLRASRDGIIVAMHDKTVDRTTNGTGEVMRLSAAERMTYLPVSV